MADSFCDHGVYAENIGAAPTWGVPQEGDGSSKDAATVSSVASIVLPGQPSAGNLLTICGLTLGATSGGTYNYTIGGSLTATVNNICAAINSNSGLGAATVGASVAIGTPKVCNLMFARNVGGTTVEIMMRVGSTTLNHATNSNVAISASGWAPTITQFVGGTGGCWGWLINPAALGVASSIAIRTYGLMVSKPMVWAAAITQLDFTWARTQGGKTIVLPAGQHIDRGNVGFPLNLIFDTNTKWTGDSGTGVVRVELSTTASGFTYFRPENSGTASCAVSYSCLKKGNFELAFSIAAGSSTLSLFNGMSGAFAARGMRFVEIATPAVSSNVFINHVTYTTVRLYDCDLDCSAYPRSNLSFGPRHVVDASGAGVFHWIGGAIKFNLTGVPGDVTGFFFPAAGGMVGAANYGIDIRYEGVDFSTASAYKVKWQTASTAAVGGFISVVLKDNKGLALDGGFLGIQLAFDWRKSPNMNSMLFVGGDTGRHQRQERWNGVAEWNPDASPAYPTLAATQQDGTVYSMRLYWLNTTASNGAQPFGYTGARRNRLADGVRTITQEICFDSTKGIDGRHVSLRLSYTDSDGVPRTQQTFGVDPVASSASWTGIGSWTDYVARKWVLVTDYPVKQHTMIECEVMLNGLPPGGSNTDVFMDPEPSIT